MAVVWVASGAETPAANGAGGSSCARSGVLGRCTHGRQEQRPVLLEQGRIRAERTAVRLRGLTLVGTHSSSKNQRLGRWHSPRCYLTTLQQWDTCPLWKVTVHFPHNRPAENGVRDRHAELCYSSLQPQKSHLFMHLNRCPFL